MRATSRAASIGAASIGGLVIGYGVVFSFFAAGLFGDGAEVPAAVWERALRGTILLGPFLGAFLLLGFLAWKERWSTGLTPWTAGASGVILVARHEAGILSRFDIVWLAGLLLLAGLASREEDDEDEE